MPRKRTRTNRTFTKNAPSEVNYDHRNIAQEEAFEIYTQNDITFFLGPAGSGKTTVAVYCALYNLLARIEQHKVNKIILTRPIVEAGENLGFLPGEVADKVRPYMQPVYDCVGKMVTNSAAFVNEYFELAPLAYMRGKTLTDCVGILDEAQNCTNEQLKLFVTRIGQNCKLVITGDPEQTDIGNRSALNKVVAALEGVPGVGVYRFDASHIVRHPILSKVLAKWPS